MPCKRRVTRNHHVRKTKSGKMVPIKSHSMFVGAKKLYSRAGFQGKDTAFAMKESLVIDLSKYKLPKHNAKFVKRVSKLGKGKKSPI